MRSVPEIFKAVIAAGAYDTTATGWSDETSPHMCFALRIALNNGHISRAEEVEAYQEIQKYLDGFSFLRSMLSANKLPNDGVDRLGVYMDWDNRPPCKGWEEIHG